MANLAFSNQEPWDEVHRAMTKHILDKSQWHDTLSTQSTTAQPLEGTCTFMILVKVEHQMPVVTVEERGTSLQSALTLLLIGPLGKEWKYL